MIQERPAQYPEEQLACQAARGHLVKELAGCSSGQAGHQAPSQPQNAAVGGSHPVVGKDASGTSAIAIIAVIAAVQAAMATEAGRNLGRERLSNCTL